jgi:hypothetical protein
MRGRLKILELVKCAAEGFKFEKERLVFQSGSTILKDKRVTE